MERDDSTSLSAGERKARALQDLVTIGARQRGESGRIREDDHIEADQVLLWLINDADVTAAFGLIEKWYTDAPRALAR